MGFDMTITAERLREVLNYNPDTGVFRWRVVLSNRVRLGQVAGNYDKGRWIISIDNRGYFAHQLAWLWMTGGFPHFEIDHIDGDSTHNRWFNLRKGDRQKSSANTKRYRNNTSGFKGVTWDADRSKWMAQIHPNGRHIHLGRFDTPEEAHEAYMAAAIKYFGEFASGGRPWQTKPQSQSDLANPSKIGQQMTEPKSSDACATTCETTPIPEDVLRIVAQLRKHGVPVINAKGEPITPADLAELVREGLL